MGLSAPADSKQSPFVRSSLTAERCLRSIGRVSGASMTSESFVQQTLSGLTLSAADSLARTSASRGRVLGLQGKEADFGESTPVLLAKYDQSTSLWKTSQLCLDGGLATFSETWPRAGMTRSGIAYQREPLEPFINATEYGFLPTLGKCEGLGASRKRFRNSQDFRGAKMSEGLRTSPTDQTYIHPRFAEVVMGFPPGWTELEPSEMPLSRKSRKSSAEQSCEQKECSE